MTNWSKSIKLPRFDNRYPSMIISGFGVHWPAAEPSKLPLKTNKIRIAHINAPQPGSLHPALHSRTIEFFSWNAYIKRGLTTASFFGVFPPSLCLRWLTGWLAGWDPKRIIPSASAREPILNLQSWLHALRSASHQTTQDNSSCKLVAGYQQPPKRGAPTH